MGFFNNFDKEGPGVPKDSPKKKTLFFFFEILFRNFWKMMLLNLIYWLLSILPFGFSAVGITNVTRSLSREKHTFGLSDFFDTIKKNWKQAVIIGLINTVVLFLLCFAVYFYFGSVIINGFDIYGMLGGSLSAVFLLIFISMKFYIWFMVITFDLKIKQIYKNSFRLVAANFKNNSLILLSLAAFWGIIYLLGLVPLYIGNAIGMILIIFMYPTYRYLAIQLGVFGCIKKLMIDPYYEEHPELDIEKRKMLGIYDEDNDDDTLEEEI